MARGKTGGRDTMHKCPHCQKAGCDEVHMFYTCPSLRTSRHPMIQKTQHLVEVARRDKHNPPCDYLRGPQPIANTTPTAAPFWSAYPVGQGVPHCTLGGQYAH
eukprot:9680064-Karenia_brevis.AAC.1